MKGLMMVFLATVAALFLAGSCLNAAAEKEANFNRYEFTLPSISGAADSGFAVYETDSFELIDSQVPPPDEKRRGGFAAFACPGQYQQVSFAVYALKDLTGLKTIVTDLRGKGGSIPARQFQVNYIRRCPERLYYGDPPQNTAIVDRFLERKDSLNLPAQNFKEIWVTVKVPENAAAGIYSGNIRITADNSPAKSFPLQLEVLPFKLDPVPNKKYGVYYRGLADRKRLGVELQDIAEHGATVLQAALEGGRTQSKIKYLSGDGGKIEINTQRVEKWLQSLRDCHFPSGPTFVYLDFERLANILGHKDVPLGWRNPRGQDGTSLDTDPVFQEYADKVIQRLSEIQKNYPEYEIILTDLDEIEWGLVPLWVRLVRAAKQTPRFRTYQTFSLCSSPTGTEKELAEIAPYTDIVSGGSVSHWLSKGLSIREISDKVRSYGMEFWIYPNPTGAAMVPKRYRLTNGLYLWLMPISASVPYTYQAPQGDFFNDADGYDFGFSFFSDEDGRMVATKSWEAYRQGIYDLQYIHTLENLIERKKAKAPVEARKAAEFLDRLRARLSASPEGVDPLKVWLKNLSNRELDRIRREIVDRIMSLQKS